MAVERRTMSAITGFGRVWTLEYLLRERVVEQLHEAARLAAVDFTGSVPKLREILEDLRREVEMWDRARQPEVGSHYGLAGSWS
jgi:hypothetical protein